jgi:hypothetical protein
LQEERAPEERAPQLAQRPRTSVSGAYRDRSSGSGRIERQSYVWVRVVVEPRRLLEVASIVFFRAIFGAGGKHE